MSKIEIVNCCSVPCAIGPAAKEVKEFIEEIKEIKEVIEPKNNDSQNYLEDINMKEIQKEQFNLEKHVNEICQHNYFKHLNIFNQNFIIDQKHNFAYCQHAKV